MAVKIRLRRMGAHKKPFYRIIVAEARSPRDGRFIEELGYYNPLTDPATVKIDAEKAKKWLSTGAQPTDTVRALFSKAGISKPVKEELLSGDSSDDFAVDMDDTNDMYAIKDMDATNDADAADEYLSEETEIDSAKPGAKESAASEEWDKLFANETTTVETV